MLPRNKLNTDFDIDSAMAHLRQAVVPFPSAAKAGDTSPANVPLDDDANGWSAAARIAKAVRRTGTETVERIAAELAGNHRSRGGVGRLLTPADVSGTEPRQQRAGS